MNNFHPSTVLSGPSISPPFFETGVANSSTPSSQKPSSALQQCSFESQSLMQNFGQTVGNFGESSVTSALRLMVSQLSQAV